MDEGEVLAQDAEWGLRAGGRGGTMLASAHADRTRELYGGSLSPAKAAELGNLGRTPAVAVTAYADEKNRRKALECGFDQVLTKPVDPDQMFRTLASLSPSR